MDSNKILGSGEPRERPNFATIHQISFTFLALTRKLFNKLCATWHTLMDLVARNTSVVQGQNVEN